MTPGARIAVAIAALEQMEGFWREGRKIPTDRLLNRFYKERRFMGSRDRGTVSELIYRVLRYQMNLDWWLGQQTFPQTMRNRVIAALILFGDFTAETLTPAFVDGPYAPEPLNDDEQSLATMLQGKPLQSPDMPTHVRLNVPEWLMPHLEESFGDRLEAEMEAMMLEAPVDLRVNTLKTTREELLAELDDQRIECGPSPVSPVGIRLTRRQPVFVLPAFREGRFEMQDEGSQMVGLIVDARPGHRVVDFCAGAGGKTLAMAATMENKGRILAWDTSAKRLGEMPARLARAGVSNVQYKVLSSEADPFIKRHKQTADRVLVDAPCSGSGTWRRNPDLKWRTTPTDLEELRAIQARVLASAARLVKPGGRLIYATCSLLKSENEQQVETFLAQHPHFRVVCAQKIWDKTLPEDGGDEVSYLWVTPRQDGVDGFFAAVMVNTGKKAVRPTQ